MSKISGLPLLGSLTTSDLVPVVDVDSTITGRATVETVRGPTAPSYTRTLFVAKHGNDSNDGANPARPFATISAAITAANTLGPAVDNRVSIAVVDNGVYSEDVEQPDYCDIEAPLATLYGNVELGDNTQFNWFRVRPTANSQTLAQKAGSHTGTTYCRIVEVDGTGATSGQASGQGSITNTFCFKNSANAGILFLWTPKIWVPQNGEGIGDSSTGQGHMHVYAQDLYGAGDNALLVAGNIVNSSIVVIFGHMLEINGATGVVGIKMGSSGDCYAMGTQIKLPSGTPYDVNVNRNLRITCPDIQGTPIGNAQVEFSNRRIIAPDLPTSATGLPSGAMWNDSGTVKIVP